MASQTSSVMMSSPSPTNGAQDLHENLLCIGDTAFPGLSNQHELNYVLSLMFYVIIVVGVFNNFVSTPFFLFSHVHPLPPLPPLSPHICTRVSTGPAGGHNHQCGVHPAGLLQSQVLHHCSLRRISSSTYSGVE